MSSYKPYRVRVESLPAPGFWMATFIDKQTEEVQGSIAFGAPNKPSATHFAMGYCTAFYKMGLPVKFDTASGSS